MSSKIFYTSCVPSWKNMATGKRFQHWCVQLCDTAMGQHGNALSISTQVLYRRLCITWSGRQPKERAISRHSRRHEITAPALHLLCTLSPVRSRAIDCAELAAMMRNQLRDYERGHPSYYYSLEDMTHSTPRTGGFRLDRRLPALFPI